MLVQTETIIENNGKENPNLTLDIINNVVTLNINSSKIFRTLCNQPAIEKLIHDKLCELLLSHIQKMAKKEETFQNEQYNNNWSGRD